MSGSPLDAALELFGAAPAGPSLLLIDTAAGELPRLAPLHPLVVVARDARDAPRLERVLRDRGCPDAEIVTLGGASGKIPLPDAALARVVIEACPELVEALPPDRLAVELARVVRHEGLVLWSLPNPWSRRLGLDRMRGSLEGTAAAHARRDDPARGTQPGRAPSPSAVTRAMVRQGFAKASIYVPLPEASNPQIVLPANDPVIVRYALDHLVRKNSRAMRLALAAARALNRAGRFHWIAPHAYLYFRLTSARTATRRAPPAEPRRSS